MSELKPTPPRPEAPQLQNEGKTPSPSDRPRPKSAQEATMLRQMIQDKSLRRLPDEALRSIVRLREQYRAGRITVNQRGIEPVTEQERAAKIQAQQGKESVAPAPVVSAQPEATPPKPVEEPAAVPTPTISEKPGQSAKPAEASTTEQPADATAINAGEKQSALQTKTEATPSEAEAKRKKSLTEPLNTANLDEKSAEEIRVALQYEQQNSEFLDLDDPMVKKLQSYLDRMRDPASPPMRVLITRNNLDSIGYVLEDGTTVLSQALISDMDFEEEVVAVLAHEQVHFEKEHHKKRKEKGVGGNVLTRAMSKLARMRVHEYQADLALAAKLDSLGLDSLSLESAIQKIGRNRNEGKKKKEKRRVVSWVHGSSEDRALNTIITHNLVDFPSSNTTVESRKTIDASWRREVKPSVSQILDNPRSESEWRVALGTAKPLVLHEYAQKLIYKVGFTPDLAERIGFPHHAIHRREALRRLDTVMELLDARLAASGLPEDKRRFARLLCATSGIDVGFGMWKNITDNNVYDAFPGRKYRARTDLSWMVKPSDFNPEAIGSLIDMHREGWIYAKAGLPVPEEKKPPAL